MLRWALILFVISILSGALGFTGISRASGGLAKILFFVFLALTVLVVIVALAVGRLVF